MEKSKPTHDLAAIMRVFSSADALVMTGTARRAATDLGFSASEIVAVIQSIQREHFRKSMTAHFDHTRWQDVYFVPSEAGLLYVKFTDDAVAQFTVLSFKEQ